MIDATSLINGSAPTPGTTATNNNSTSTSAKTPSDSLGRDAFLRLLTTQLAHQDPVQPQADGEFIAQLATFSSLEKLTAISTKLDQIGSALGVTLTGTETAPTETNTRTTPTDTGGTSSTGGTTTGTTDTSGTSTTNGGK